MVKVREMSKNKKIAPRRRELRVVLNRANVDEHIPSKISERQTSKKPQSSFQSQSYPVPFANSISRRRELSVRISPLDIQVATAISGSLVHRSSTRVPILHPTPFGHRHAVVFRCATYRKGLDVAPEKLEELSRNPHSCGMFKDSCGYCGAKFFSKEPKAVRIMCCKDGKVSVPIPSCPPELKPLYTDHSERSNEFVSNIRSANSLFAMASLKSAPLIKPVRGLDRRCFSICGQVYQNYPLSDPNSQDSRKSAVGHFYFLDVDEVLNRRSDLLENRVRRETLQLLEKSLRTHNRLIQGFKTLSEVLRKQADRRFERPINDVTVTFSRTGDRGARRCRHGLPPRPREIAGVFSRMHSRSGGLQLYPRKVHSENDKTIKPRQEFEYVDATSDPMMYPLLFPSGENETHFQGIHHENHPITMLDFYRFRVQCRDAFSLLHNGGKLFQQYLVDAWVRVEARDLWRHQQHPQTFRFAARQSVRRALTENAENADKMGRAIVLPSASPGGSRHSQRLYVDAMAIAARHGKPDLFVTFACNPNWPDVTENLEYLQTPENRPDLVCRVFHTKLSEFLDDVTNKGVFGTVLNYHYMIDFQKDGFPRARIVVTFVPDDKIRTSDRVDEIISARIPDPDLQPGLYELVARYQVHHPCGSLDPKASCMDGGRCRKFFPKNYHERTILSANGEQRPIYKRPRDNRVVQYPFRTVTNTRIIPYNPYTLAKFQTRVNFEVGSLPMLKDLYKYVTRNSDYVTINGEQTAHDQFQTGDVRSYLDGRYVSSMEATWRLLEFRLHGRSHSVMVLPVHLPGEHYVVFSRDDNPEDLKGRLASRSKLEAWFLLNTEDVDARRFRYGEIPDHFDWDNGEARWCRLRQVSKAIGRLADVTSKRGNVEILYLRLLLRRVRGATSFESLRTVNGVVRKTFKEACGALHLLSRTDEYNLCLKEAATLKRPHHMRQLYGQIVGSLNVETLWQIPLLWQNHKDDMIQDYVDRGLDSGAALISCGEEIETMIQRNRSEFWCTDLGILVDDERIERPLRYNIDLLNAEQKRLFLRIVQAVCRINGKTFPMDLHRYSDIGGRVVSPPGEQLFFVDGAGGTGKTFLHNALISYVSCELKIPVIAVAWTGIAASLLIGGTTASRAFKLPLNLSESSTVGWHVESEESQAIKRAGLILWDEAPTTHRYAVEAVDRYLNEIAGGTGWYMGGKCCVFGGDFRQAAPAIPHGHRALIIDASLKRMHFWDKFSKLQLTVNMRAAKQAAIWNGFPALPVEDLGNRTFAEWLLALGENRLPHVLFEGLKSFPADLIEIPSLFTSATLMDLIFFVYPEGFASGDIGERAILCLTRDSVEHVNNIIFDLLPGVSRTYTSLDECKHQSEDELQVPQVVLNSVNVASLPPHELKLKVGAVVTLLCNLDIERGECNGARMKVTGLGDHIIQCQFVSGVNKGRAVWLPRIRMTARDPAVPQDIIRTQFPVRIAYSMTINKSHGQTLERVGVYLKTSCFSHGQLYTAFSRVEVSLNVRVYIAENEGQGSFGHKWGKTFTRNVVFHALLDNKVSPIERERRQVISREDVAKRGEVEGIFGCDGEEEDVDISHILHSFEEFVSDVETVEYREPYVDPYVDESGIVVRNLFPPPRVQAELATRVSTIDRPGTSGLNLARPSPPSPQLSSDSD